MSPDIHEASKHKKKKRKHHETDGSADAGDTEKPEKKQKKKRKKSKPGDDGAPAIQDPIIPVLGEESGIPEMDKTSAAAMASALLAALVAASNNDQPVASTSSLNDIPYNALPSHLPLEMSFGDAESNDLVLKALQDMDLAKLTNVLKSLGQAGTVPHIPIPVHPMLFSGHTPVGQVPPSAQSILSSSQQPLQSSNEGFTSHDHAHLLSNKWLSPSQLATLVKSQGLVYKKGKFSVLEEQQLSSAIEQYRSHKGLSEQQLHEVIFPKDEKSRENAFWSEITAAVPQRPIAAVYHHIRRVHHPLRLQGKWTPDEDQRLRSSVQLNGQLWEKVSLDVGRGASDCRDRYRNHIVNKDTHSSGTWSRDEEVELTRIVTEMTVQQGRDADNDVFWTSIANKMGGKRTRAQCRIKWTDSLNLSRKNNGLKPRWGNQDSYILVHKLDALQIHDDSEIDWKLIPDPQWNIWSAHVLQRRWRTMKKSVKGHEYMSFREIMDILKIKKVSESGSNKLGKRHANKVTSSERVDDDDSD